MSAPTLFDIFEAHARDATPRSRKSDPRTSHSAAQRMAPAAPALEAQILELLGRRHTGLTKDQIGLKLGIDPRRWPSCASALSRLKNAGKLRWTGEILAGQNVWALAVESVDVHGETL